MAMNTKKEITVFVVCSALFAKVFILCVAFLQAKLLGEHLIKQGLIEHLQSSTPTFIATGDNFNFEWPWYYILLTCLIFSIFWYFLGKMAFKKFGQPYWRYSLFSPAVYFLLSFDMGALFYMLVIAFGGLSVYKSSPPASQSI
jgi:hypothetical protein